MEETRNELIDRAEAYARRKGLTLEYQLGFGVHGIVFATDCQSASKVQEHDTPYRRERDVYLRLRTERVLDVRQFHVPQLVDYDDTLPVIEMTIVTRPFVLDVAGAYLDEPPDYPEEVWDE